MAPTNDQHSAERNQLLATLPSQDYEPAAPLEQRAPGAQPALTRPDEPVAHVYFLRGAVASILAHARDLVVR